MSRYTILPLRFTLQRAQLDKAELLSTGVVSVKLSPLEESSRNIPQGTSSRAASAGTIRSPSESTPKYSVCGADLPGNISAEAALSALQQRCRPHTKFFACSDAILKIANEENILAGISGVVCALACMKMALLGTRAYNLTYFEKKICHEARIQWSAVDQACNELYLHRSAFAVVFADYGVPARRLRLLPTIKNSVVSYEYRLGNGQAKGESCLADTSSSHADTSRLLGTEWWLEEVSEEDKQERADAQSDDKMHRTTSDGIYTSCEKIGHQHSEGRHRHRQA